MLFRSRSLARRFPRRPRPVRSLRTRSAPCAPPGSAPARLRQTQLCPTATWAPPQSRRLAAGAGGLCSSPSSWLPPEVRSVEPGCWGGATGEHSGAGWRVPGQMRARWEPLSACHDPTRGREAARTAWQGRRLSAKCPGWVVGTRVCRQLPKQLPVQPFPTQRARARRVRARFRVRGRIRVRVSVRVVVRVRVRFSVRVVIKPIPLYRYPLARKGILFGGRGMEKSLDTRRR